MNAQMIELSHVLLALGLDEDTTHYAIRIGIGRFNTFKEINFTVNKIKENIESILKTF